MGPLRGMGLKPPPPLSASGGMVVRCRDGQTGGTQVGSVPRRQRDRPVAWVVTRLPPNDASETIDGVMDLPLDNDLCARVEPWGDPSSQAAVDGSEGADGGGFRAEETLEVHPCSHCGSTGSAGASDADDRDGMRGAMRGD